MEQLTLKNFQRLFSHAATQGAQDEDYARLLETLKPGGTLTAPDALNVYGDGVHIRLTEALGETFEAVWWVCGDEGFFALAKHFIQAQPSNTYNLSTYGKEFPEFLDEAQPFPDLPFLGSLARYEWTFKELFHTKQHESVTPDAMQSLTEEATIHFRFGTAVKLFHAPHAVYDLWTLRGTEHDGKPPTEWDQPQSLILHKKDKQIFVEKVGEAEYGILLALQHGASLESAIASAVDAHPEFGQQQISGLFQLIFHTGIIERIDIQPSNQ